MSSRTGAAAPSLLMGALSALGALGGRRLLSPAARRAPRRCLGSGSGRHRACHQDGVAACKGDAIPARAATLGAGRRAVHARARAVASSGVGGNGSGAGGAAGEQAGSATRSASTSVAKPAAAPGTPASAAAADAADGTPSSGASIRRRFLEFYEARAHSRLPSASLIPEDPTVLLTIAGMLQFKPVFLGQVPRSVARATTTQKCVRTNDIENVGVTKRHHTFFEMLGNFSFGDYFKEDAVRWAWELATVEYGLPKERVWVSVYEDDDEALRLWRDVVGVDERRIQRLGAKDNFWASGATGPCGPCTEMYYDFTPEKGTEGADLEDDERFIEFYNVVFMQYNRTEAGELVPLENPNIDTGMGLERMAQILQEVPNNYETDLIFPIIQRAAELGELDYHALGEREQRLLRVVGDHTRAVTYLISDGVAASNVGRGYVVRRLIRRVVRCARQLGIPSETSVLPQVAQVAIDMSAECCPAVKENAERVLNELEREEAKFNFTLERGDKRLAEMIDAAKADGGDATISGADAFLLYDTYGFPVEITEEAAAEAGAGVDLEGFRAEMEAAQARSKAAHAAVSLDMGGPLAALAEELGATPFLGYDHELAPHAAAVTAIVAGGEPADEVAEEGELVQVALDATPFYAEGGGQVGDRGVLRCEASGALLEVTGCRKAGPGAYMHEARLLRGALRVGDAVSAAVDAPFRRKVRANHTATHLLQSALKAVVGDDISQAGSLVTDERLRFDFNCPRGLSDAEIEQVEDLINDWVADGTELVATEMPIDEAKEKGAVAMFGEKYGATVRVVDVPGVSMELCGGTHVANIAEIGGFKVVSEAGVASGVRRIEAVTGAGVVGLLRERDAVVRELGASLKVAPQEIAERVGAMQKEAAAAAKEVAALKAELATARAASLAAQAVAGGAEGTSYVVAEVEGADGKSLASAAEGLREALGEGGAVVLASAVGGKVAFAANFGPQAVAAGAKAGTVVGATAKVCGGGGGGKPNVAQAGGRDASKLPEALDTAREAIATALAA